ncbi:12-(S)-hydroxy-5,8,10,14-eicosatetraenoic acid receptor [Mastacembelus armatus]|uniref:G protein-coupled receptor 31 n=1 Tax=Mastacembelus armatus TaxID=205130 RepID=A0A3Q3MTI4_9TELE|nr:12-(S)-hydroxy-5,8,10,14-eicosatetraenoic acid receptor-like [Mastacembelus armatus]
MISNAVMSRQHNMSTNLTADYCKVPNLVTYQTLSWVMTGQFVLGLPLNLSVLYIFIFRFKFWKNKSIFLFNIVVADLFLVASLPAKVYDYQQGLKRSKDTVVCKILLFIVFLNRGASIVFLTTLCIDRYFGVVHLGRRNIVRVFKKSPQISTILWLVLLPLIIPTIINTSECCNSHGCKFVMEYHGMTDIYREVAFLIQIIIPFIILVYCTVRIVNRLRKKTVGEKTKLRRAVWVVMSVVVVFSICFLPCTIARVLLLAVRLKAWQAAEDIVLQVYNTLEVFSYTDCLLDPLVYCFFNSGFKNAYISTFCPTFLQKRPPNSACGMGTGATATTTTSGGKIMSLPIVEK